MVKLNENEQPIYSQNFDFPDSINSHLLPSFFVLRRIILLAAEEVVSRYVPRGSSVHSTRAMFYFTTSHSAQKATRAGKQLKDDLPVSVPQAQTEATAAQVGSSTYLSERVPPRY